MPWSAGDAKRHIKGLSPRQASAWAKIANKALADCQQRGGKDCEGRAIRVANKGVKNVGTIAKIDEAQGLVYGWASIVSEKGELIEDSQGDVIEPAELDQAMVNFMKDYRAAGVMHQGDAVGVIVESMVVSPDKLEAMGIDAAEVPVGAWIGVKLDPTSETFAKVKSGELAMFSIQGSGERIAV